VPAGHGGPARAILVRMATHADAALRSRLVDAALDLFARRGVDGTRVEEIEAAAGVAPGRGAFADHFTAKEETLAVAIDRHAASLDDMAALLHRGPLAPDLRTELAMLARWVIAEHHREDRLLRVLQRDRDRFPALVARVHDEIVERGYREAAAWLARRIADGGFRRYDAEAVAVVALGSLVAYDAQRALLGAPPLGVDEDRFVETWVEAWLRVAHTAEVERAGAG